MKKAGFILFLLIFAILSSCTKENKTIISLLERVIAQNDSLRIKVNALQKSTDSISNVLKLTNQQVQGMDKKIDSIKNQLVLLVAQINQLNTQLSAQNSNIADLQSQIKILQDKCSALYDMLYAYINQLPNIKIGDKYQGGVIVYIYKNGDPGYDPNAKHGIICAETDATINSTSSYYSGTGCMWQIGIYDPVQQTMYFEITNALGTAIGTGKSNTDLILKAKSKSGKSFPAVELAVSYSAGGYNDWVLPSKDEIMKVYENKTLVGGFLNNAPDLWYWTSTETNQWYAESLNFVNGQFGSPGGYKGPGGTPYKVRSIRYF